MPMPKPKFGARLLVPIVLVVLAAAAGVLLVRYGLHRLAERWRNRA
jgi:hypothetical protein